MCIRDRTRSEHAFYKYGRATPIDDIGFKIKRRHDGEGTIKKVIQREMNTNPATTDKLGNMKRSSAKAGMVPVPSVGSFLVQLNSNLNVEFAVSATKLGHKKAAELWKIKDTLVNKTLKFKYSRMSQQGKPIDAVFLGFCDDL